ncbi:hypothetical protein [Budvicia aquatica]|nr:hypothetical protein [Budvicia aquatica]
MKTVQGEVSLPVVQRYVDKLLNGEVPPLIKVDGDVIVEGNHRYVAGKIVGLISESTPGVVSPSRIPLIKLMSNTKIDPIDWSNH